MWLVVFAGVSKDGYQAQRVHPGVCLCLYLFHSHLHCRCRIGRSIEPGNGAAFKCPGSIFWIHGVEGDPTIDIAGKSSDKACHDLFIDHGSGHGLADKLISGEEMKHSGTEIVTDKFHGRINITQSTYGFLINLLKVAIFSHNCRKNDYNTVSCRQDQAWTLWGSFSSLYFTTGWLSPFYFWLLLPCACREFLLSSTTPTGVYDHGTSVHIL